MTNLVEAVARAMKYVVVVKPGTFPSDDTYHIMEGPICIVQISGDFDDDHAANAACGEMNVRAAIAVTFAHIREQAARDDVIEAASRAYLAVPCDPALLKFHCDKVNFYQMRAAVTAMLDQIERTDNAS